MHKAPANVSYQISIYFVWNFNVEINTFPPSTISSSKFPFAVFVFSIQSPIILADDNSYPKITNGLRLPKERKYVLNPLTTPEHHTAALTWILNVQVGIKGRIIF